jgi:hypothetical protein
MSDNKIIKTSRATEEHKEGFEKETLVATISSGRTTCASRHGPQMDQSRVYGFSRYGKRI